MGALKKSVRGLVVVHPMTALGREMGLKAVTGYAKKPSDPRRGDACAPSLLPAEPLPRRRSSAAQQTTVKIFDFAAADAQQQGFAPAGG
ncbi:hypothetical protein GGER_00370 [Serratia rubidaea]